MSNLELVKAFKAAKRIIAQGKTHYICHALQDAYRYRATDYPTMWRAKELISVRLGVNASLEQWLEVEHGIRVDSHRYADRARIRATRVAWLNSLIKEFS